MNDIQLNEEVNLSSLGSSQKRHNQWRRWSEDIIPALVKPYMEYLEVSRSLRVIVDAGVDGTGQCHNCLEELEITYCLCTPAPVQLMKRGLFACSPVAPTLAVDLRLLEFMKTLFVRLTPNTTAWCEALECFLDAQGYQLQSKDNLRRRFSNAYHWYSVLTIYMEDHITTLVHSFSPSSIQQESTQPSNYLCARCPLCFGGNLERAKTDQDDLDCIVCLDACFTQKRTNNPRNSAACDPPNPTNTVFIPDSEVKVMEDFIEKQRSCSSNHHSLAQTQQEDRFEDGMRVPVSVLDGCGDSFHAADEKRQKASTRFFADTGLMALLCRHDRVLWLVNMTSAGEKQHYALVLVKNLFEHLPSNMTVGLLYDIGCQLERSCHKWKLLDDGILSRLKFGISVFHAYGHQWPCQIVYHPRKCVGFGLSDGEGCERLWSSLKMLIPILRVSGYHQRLFVLDNQIRHFDKKSFSLFGQWLDKKWSLCKRKKMMAWEALCELHVDMQTLRHEWAAQVELQTRPLPRQSKNKGSQQLAYILSLEKTVEDYQSHVDKLENDLINNHVHDIVDFNLQLAAAKGSLSKASHALRQKKSALGVSAKTDLYLLKNNKWLQTQTNAQALKTRIRERLCQRKFELERLERSYRNSVNESHIQSHVESSLKRREPAILKLVSTYNNLCGELQSMIRLHKAPPGAIPPTPIPSKGIFQLDVDSDIWQDVGLGECHPDPPRWLADESVRKGIKLMLEIDRCNEEERRLSRERSVLQEWFSVEWLSVQTALEEADKHYKYHLKKYRENLVAAYVKWEARVRHIPCAWLPSRPWGPTGEDIANHLATLYDPSCCHTGNTSTVGDCSDGGMCQYSGGDVLVSGVGEGGRTMEGDVSVLIWSGGDHGPIEGAHCVSIQSGG
ncbi:hypothetical protein EDD15DRAFT_2393533 [Pisolithus albus]|nr:hypothetical protein EDD15DRAFT_2393533 [Pisolithus albus]